MDEYGENSGLAGDGAPQNNTEAGYLASLDRDGDPVAGVAEGKLALAEQVAQPGGGMWPNTRQSAVAPSVYAAGQRAVGNKVTEQLREERRLRTEALENDPRNRAEPDPPGQTGYQSDFGEPMSRDKFWEAVHSTVGGAVAGITARTAGAGPVWSKVIGMGGSFAGKTAYNRPESMTAVTDDSLPGERWGTSGEQDGRPQGASGETPETGWASSPLVQAANDLAWGTVAGEAASRMGAGTVGAGVISALGSFAGKVARNHPEAVTAVVYDDLP